MVWCWPCRQIGQPQYSMDERVALWSGGPTIDLHTILRNSVRDVQIWIVYRAHVGDEITDWTCRTRLTRLRETFLFCSIPWFIWQTLDASGKWCCQSTFFIFDPCDVKMLPAHFGPPSRGNTFGITPVLVVRVRGCGHSYCKLFSRSHRA